MRFASRHARSLAVGILLLVMGPLLAEAGQNLGNVGTFAKWARIEIQMTGPNSTGTGSPNPFAIVVDVEFTAPGGKKWTVPAFYDGNGSGGLDGNVWKVRFSADEAGSWSFVSTSSNGQLNGNTGTFSVTAPPGNAGFYTWGRLEYTGTASNKIRYLKFRDGSYWLKAGCDDPENFLGNFSNYNTLSERKAAVDYLAARGVNSMYIMTHNIDGDARDVWPWLGSTSTQAKSNGGSDSRFDVAKLEEWRNLFEYMNTKGVAPYLILEDDSPWTGYDHARYYRELIARFGYLPALLFNFGEEHNEANTLSQALSWMQTLESIDPYDHPRGIHNVNTPNDAYVDAAQVDFTAIQTSFANALNHNQRTIDWINRCKTRNKRILMVNFDEPRPLLDRKGWWSAYMGGGVWEVHTSKPYDRPMSAWEPAWTEIGGARAFMETIPFWDMEPNNGLVTSGTGYCLAKPGEAYATYLPNGGTVQLNLTAGVTYDVAWWRATNGQGGAFQSGGTTAGGSQGFTAPGSGDWALRLLKSGGAANAAPSAADGSASVTAGGSVPVTLSYSDPDGPGPYTFTITQAPAQGAVSGSGANRTYTANTNATGTDTFRWKVNDGLVDSNIATVTITIGTGNQPPVASNQSVTTTEGKAVSIPLSYNDPDNGPSPYTFTITQNPSNGTVVPDNLGSNDHTYTPNAGFTGTDTFKWKVNDGAADSNVATVTITVNANTTGGGVDPVQVATGAYPDLAVDGAGDVHLVYGRSGTLYYRKWTASTSTWSAEQSTGLGTGRVERSEPEVATDSQNRPHVFVGSSYAYWNGSSWVSINPGVTRDSALAIDSQDNVYICRRGGANGGWMGLRKRAAGSNSFISLPDPDTANGLPLGRNDHVYGHVFVSPADNSVHIVYRHGAPMNLAYRGSSDGGQNWFGGGVSGDDLEAPSGAAAADGSIYVVSGNGTVYRRTATPSSWSSLGRAVTAASRDLPALGTDQGNNLYVTSFGGKFNVRSVGSWAGQATLPGLSGQPLGFVESAGGPGNFAYVVWEEGSSVNNDLPNSGTNTSINFASVASDGTVGGGGGSSNQAPSVSLTSPTSGATFTEPATISLQATASDPDGTVVQVDFTQGGTLLGSATASPYSIAWSNVAAGSYTLTAVATDDQGASTTSSPVTITVNASGPGNQAPSAADQSLSLPQDTSTSISLSYTDPDGPGPYTFTVLGGPFNGSLSGTGQTLTYTPNSGYVGTDSFTWQVNDGQASSNIATVTITVTATGGGGLATNTSPANYLWDTLDVGKVQYVDRTYTFSSVPGLYVGLDYLRTANDDKSSQGIAWITFDVSQNVTVFIAHDDRISPKPTWMSGYVDTGDDLVSGGGIFSLYAQTFPPGTISLGGNIESGTTGNSMYTVVLAPGGGGATDTDGDGLSDADEVTIYGTDPTNPDTDGDGMSDGAEVQYNLDPLDGDQDGNGIPDGLDDWNGNGQTNQVDITNGINPGTPPAPGPGPGPGPTSGGSGGCGATGLEALLILGLLILIRRFR